MNLRPYQHDCVEAIFGKWKDHQSTLAVLPTGAGKSIIFAGVIDRIQPLKTMVLAHREELIFQAQDKINQVTGIQSGIEMGAFRAQMAQADLFGGDSPQVVVATVQTLNSRAGDRKRMGRFNPHDFGLVIIDEFHHAPAKSYVTVLNYFKQNPSLKVLGVTATPDRLDGVALGKVMDSVAYRYDIIQAISDGWLCEPQQQLVRIDGLDYSHIRTTAGDLNGGDLAKVMETQNNLIGVTGAIHKIMRGRRTLVFTASVAQAEVMSEIFNRYQAGCSTWVCGMTAKDKRREIVKDFAAGKYQVVCNCDCFTEGFDDPGVQVIAMAKPTKSRAKYSQMIGRAMRPLATVGVDNYDTPLARRSAINSSSKPCCEILDFVGNSGRHKLVSCLDILGGKYTDYIKEKARDIILKRGGAISVEAAIGEAEELERKKCEMARAREIARRAKITAGVSYTTREVSPFDVLDMSPLQTPRWDSGKTLSQAQSDLLKKNGVDPNKFSYHEGKAILDQMFDRWGKSLATFKQCRLLKPYGYNTKHMTQAEATRLIGMLAKQGWRRKDNGKTQGVRTPQVRGQRTEIQGRDEARRDLGSGAAPQERVAHSVSDPAQIHQPSVRDVHRG